MFGKVLNTPLGKSSELFFFQDCASHTYSTFTMVLGILHRRGYAKVLHWKLFSGTAFLIVLNEKYMIFRSFKEITNDRHLSSRNSRKLQVQGFTIAASPILKWANFKIPKVSRKSKISRKRWFGKINPESGLLSNVRCQ